MAAGFEQPVDGPLTSTVTLHAWQDGTPSMTALETVELESEGDEEEPPDSDVVTRLSSYLGPLLTSAELRVGPVAYWVSTLLPSGHPRGPPGR